MKPTPQEIKAEIEKLREIKPTIPRESKFGDNYHDAIDAQIEVLEKGVSAEAIGDRADDARTDEEALWTEDVRDAALDAAEWREGDSDFVSLADNWKDLAGK
jgi:hypothetical protein